MSISDSGARETNHSSDNCRARVGSHPEDEFADEVVALR
jgi:hypothetical protein